MSDVIEKFGVGSVIQHGIQNNRVYLMKIHKDDFPSAINYCHALVKEHGYTKIVCKVPAWAAPVFIAHGYTIEAQVPQFYNGKETAFFFAKYLDSERLAGLHVDNLAQLSEILMKGNVQAFDLDSVAQPQVHILQEQHAEEISEVYKQVFESYPFPIFDPSYITQTMQDGVIYFGIFEDTKLVAISSAEVDYTGQNAEMTDFATLPDYRGKKLAVILLSHMENHMKKMNIPTVYTIARLQAPAITITFLRNSYIYSGTLIHNTHIGGSIESMNVLYKVL
ncbi:MAG: putative beta-lysine N-acetyltransferase [Bacteroidales bacterium]